MDLDLLLNPWVISAIVVVFIIGNLASMKYLGQTHLVKKDTNKKSDMDRLIEIYKQKDAEEAKSKQAVNKVSKDIEQELNSDKS